MRNIFVISLLGAAIAAHAQTFSLSHFGVENGLSNNYVMSLAQDRKGCIWIATESGLNRFDGQQFIVYKRSNSGLSSDELNALLPDPKADKIWIGTQRDGLCCFDYATETITHLSAGDQLASNDIPQLTQASDSGIWITHYHMGIQHFDTETGKFVNYDNKTVEGLPPRYWTAVDDGRGKLYVGHVLNGLSVIDMERMTCRNYRHDPNDPRSIPGDEVFSLCIDRDKNVWVGTNNGAALFDPATGEFTSFRHEEGNEHSLLPGTVMDIKQMDNGDIFFATSMGGISILAPLKARKGTAPLTPPKGGTYNSVGVGSPPFGGIEGGLFRNLTVTNDAYGLTGPYVRRILQDSFGNIWVGSYRDGLDFISYAPNMFNTLRYTTEKQGKTRNKQVWSLCLDHNGTLWMGGEAELARIRGLSPQAPSSLQRLSIIPLPTSTLHPHAFARALHEDSEGRIWIGTWEAGLFYYEPEKGKFTQVSGDGTLPTDIRCFHEDADGKLWIGARTGLYTYYNSKLTEETALNEQMYDHLVQSIRRDSQGKLWVGTFGKGIYIFDTQGKLTANPQRGNGFPSNAINALTVDSKERVWAATRSGLVCFDSTEDMDYQVLGTAEGLANTQVRAVCEDKDGNIWVSTNGGISRLDESRKRFYNYDHRDGIPLGDYMDAASLVGNDGMLYFGSQNGTCYFDPSALAAAKKIAPVTITRFFVYSKQTESKDVERQLPLASGKITLPYNENTFKVSFNVLDYTQNSHVEFAYMLDGLEERWYDTQGERQVTFRNIPPGKYIFKVRTRIRNQEWENQIATLPVTIQPPFWLAWYAKLFYFLVTVAIIYLIGSFYKRKVNLESSLEVERKNSQNRQELNEERLRFYTNITHELRTPLTLILGPLEDLLSDGTVSPKHANKISIIHDSASRLLNLVNGILEFRKTETQNRKLSVARGDLAALVKEVGLPYKEMNRNPKVDFHICINTPETTLYFDADMMTTILNNFLSNAAKYTSEGSITLSLDSREENGVRYTEVSVSDTGHGIAPAALPHIFERYYQVNGKHQASGFGIGLALVKGLADLHEATLSVESKEEVGSTFRLRLLTDNTYGLSSHSSPTNPSRLSLASPLSGESNPIGRGNGNTFLSPLPMGEGQGERLERLLLLVVEDNVDICNYIRQSLEDYFEILTAENGSQGWTLAQERIPNVIVSDIMMPVMDGIALCRLVKEDIRTSHIPVILLTAKDSIREKEEGYTAGADSYLTKPFSAKLLHSRINNLLEAHKKLAARLVEGATAVSAPPLTIAAETVPSATANDTQSPLDREFLESITKIIEDNLEMEKMDVSFIADKMCMSHSTLYRKVKGVTDMSANEFIRKVKMKNGVKLLLSERYSISEISDMTGFSSVAYFRQCFKNEFGMSPSEYLKKK